MKATPNFHNLKPPKDAWRKKMYDIISNPIFEVFILVIILLNIVTMAIIYEG